MGYVGKRLLAPRKKTGTFRIYIVGGSTVEGLGPLGDPESHWPARLEKLLNSAQLPQSVEIINAGVAGYTSVESFVEFSLRGLALQPDLLLIYHNINDAWIAQMADGFKTDYSHVRKQKVWKNSWIHQTPNLPFWFSYQLLRGIFLQKVARHSSLIHQISDPPFSSEEPYDVRRVDCFANHIRNLIAVAQSREIPSVVIRWEMDPETPGWTPAFFEQKNSVYLRNKLKRYIAANNQALRKTSKTTGVDYLDLGRFSPHHFSDLIHFNEAGLAEMAARMNKHLMKILQTRMKKPEKTRGQETYRESPN